MKIVIDIPDYVYNTVVESGKLFSYHLNVAKAIKNGTPLPKGHGDLIDASYEVSTDGRTVYDVCGYLAPTIIKADGSEEV